MCVHPLTIMFSLLIAILSYIVTAIIRAGAMRLIYKTDSVLYSNILGNHTRAWLERGGMYLPTDIPVLWRLHKLLLNEEGKNIISGQKQRVYKFFSISMFTMVAATILLFCIFVGCAIDVTKWF